MPRQRLGQNFLTDRSVAGRIIRAAKIGPESAVLEVGPGKGALTHQLAATAKTLTVVEFDPELAESLRQRYGERDDVAVVEADARTVDPESLPVVGDGAYTLVANLPYYAATPIIRNFLESSHPPERLVVMVQREVAREMEAEPGDMGVLSIAVQVYSTVRTLFQVPPEAFTPRPRVTSAVVELIPLTDPVVSDEDSEPFFTVVRAGFKAPRKQLHNSLATGLNVDSQTARRLLDDAEIDSSRRPATLSIAEWVALMKSWIAAGRPFITHGTSRRARAAALKG